MAVIHTGRNYEIRVESGLAECRVWRRQDLSREEGAKCADEMCEGLAATGTKGQARAMLFDLRGAPPAGPLTQRAIARLLESVETLGLRIGLLMGADPLHQMQMTRIAGERAPRTGRVFTDEAEARTWLISR